MTGGVPEGAPPVGVVLLCGPAGVPGAGGPGCGAGLLVVPVGGGPPASRPRRELCSARRLEARTGPAAALRHRGQALPPVPSGPSGALYTSGAGSLMGSALEGLRLYARKSSPCGAVSS